MRYKQIVVAINYVDYKDPRRRMAQDMALHVLSLRPGTNISLVSFDFPHAPKPKIFDEYKIEHLPILKRDSSVELNNTRRLPYIKEILGYCNKIKCDVFGYINSDIILIPSVYDLLQLDFDSFMFSRSEIGETDIDSFRDKPVKVIYGGNSHGGIDGFFFSRRWWNINHGKFPDNLILGETEWDTCYRMIIKKIGCRYVEARALYHVYHDAKWDINSPGGQNNIKILNEVMK